MHDFRLDAGLHDTLKDIRESVRQLFEQLRLRSENGDISGKERLERVPALAKRNFGNLASEDSQVAIREAWRLVDFLEGREEARLKPLAREALRPVELDSNLARLRASDQWERAAASLRAALGSCTEGLGAACESGADGGGAPAPETAPETPSDRVFGLAGGSDTAKPQTDRRHPSLIKVLLGSGILIGLALLIALWPRQSYPDASVACLPLETASDDERAAHWAIYPRTSLPLPAPDPSRPHPVIFTISDPTDGGPVRSIFTTSQFSYDEAAARSTEGGGKADVRLRVGGWGDTYVSLLKFPLPDNRAVRRAVIRLVVLGDEPSSRPTTMALRVIGQSWDVAPGPRNRLWWRDCPLSEAVRRNLPVPGPPDTDYEIDITSIYNLWARGLIANNGVMLEPEHVGSYGSNVAHYPSFSTFYSTRAIDPDKRPKLILTY